MFDNEDQDDKQLQMHMTNFVWLVSEAARLTAECTYAQKHGDIKGATAARNRMVEIKNRMCQQEKELRKEIIDAGGDPDQFMGGSSPDNKEW